MPNVRNKPSPYFCTVSARILPVPVGSPPNGFELYCSRQTPDFDFVRIDHVVKLTAALAAGDTAALTPCSIGPELLASIVPAPTRRVIVVARSWFQADTIRGRLTAWYQPGPAGFGFRTIEGPGHLPLVVERSELKRIRVDADVLVRADGGARVPAVRGFPPRRTRARSAAVVIDVAYPWGESLERARRRCLAYKRAGMAASAAEVAPWAFQPDPARVEVAAVR